MGKKGISRNLKLSVPFWVTNGSFVKCSDVLVVAPTGQIDKTHTVLSVDTGLVVGNLKILFVSSLCSLIYSCDGLKIVLLSTDWEYCLITKLSIKYEFSKILLRHYFVQLCFLSTLRLASLGCLKKLVCLRSQSTHCMSICTNGS